MIVFKSASAMETRLIGVISSKDRAMQLDGTLKSFFLNCLDAQEYPLYIIYDVSNQVHLEQYCQLKKDYSGQNIHFIPQKDFRHDLLKLLIGKISWRLLTILQCLTSRFHSERSRFLMNGLLIRYPLPYVLFMVDDNLFVRNFCLNEICALLVGQSEALGFSLRLGKNLSHCYSLNTPIVLPSFQYISDGILKFNWTNADGDFGYPLEISSSVYRIHDLLPLLYSHNFHSPNELEYELARQANIFLNRKKFLLCYSQSVAFSNPINKVQQSFNNRQGNNMNYSSEELAKLFTAGHRIQVSKYRDFLPKSCHQEVDLIFESRGNYSV